MEPAYNGTSRNRKSLSLSRFLLAIWIIGAPEPRKLNVFPQKTVFRYAISRFRQVLMYIDQYVGVRVVKAVLQLGMSWTVGRSNPGKSKTFILSCTTRQSLLPAHTPTQRVLDFSSRGKAAEA